MKPSMHLGWAGLLTFTALSLSGIAAYPALPAPSQPHASAAPIACPSDTSDDRVAFLSVGPMHSAHYLHTATLLEDGTVLLVAGFGFRIPTSAAELYIPASRSFTIPIDTGGARFEHSAALLPDSTVLIAGGRTYAAYTGPFGPYMPTTSAIRYNMVTGTFTTTGSLLTARAGHTATLLPNGQVLIAGGNIGVAAAELYNPSTGTFTATGSLLTARVGHTATLLPNGQVLIAGGNIAFSDTYTPTASAELYNPSTGTFTATGSLVTARADHTATLLQQGCVLVISGNSAEIYDTARGTFKLAGRLPAYVNILAHTATLLPDGTVLLAGGSGYGFGQYSAWLAVKAYQTSLPVATK